MLNGDETGAGEYANDENAEFGGGEIDGHGVPRGGGAKGPVGSGVGIA